MTWIEGVPIVACPQHSSRRGHDPIAITLHYNVGKGSAEQICRYFANRPQRSASYHLTVGRKGDAAQGVDTDRASWHAKGIEVAADRYWPGRNNRETIGICLSNWGHAVPEVGYSTATHLVPVVGRTKRWEVYSDEQYASLRALTSKLLEAHPTIRYIVGHEDHTHGKSDPGPTFDWLRAFGGSGLIRAHNEWGRAGVPHWQYVSMRGDWR